VTVTGLNASRCFCAIRSDTIRATNRAPPSVAPNDTDIVWGEMNENNVSPTDATKSKLLTGVTGAEGLRSFFRRQKGLFTPGTGSPQM
jgi:hypothetical protein